MWELREREDRWQAHATIVTRHHPSIPSTPSIPCWPPPLPCPLPCSLPCPCSCPYPCPKTKSRKEGKKGGGGRWRAKYNASTSTSNTNKKQIAAAYLPVLLDLGLSFAILLFCPAAAHDRRHSRFRFRFRFRLRITFRGCLDLPVSAPGRFVVPCLNLTGKEMKEGRGVDIIRSTSQFHGHDSKLAHDRNRKWARARAQNVNARGLHGWNPKQANVMDGIQYKQTLSRRVYLGIGERNRTAGPASSPALLNPSVGGNAGEDNARKRAENHRHRAGRDDSRVGCRGATSKCARNESMAMNGEEGGGAHDSLARHDPSQNHCKRRQHTNCKHKHVGRTTPPRVLA